MAPEQARAQVRSITGPTSTRLVLTFLREMLVGRREHDGGSAIAELIARMQHPPAPMRATDESLPEWLDTVVTRCVQPDPAARYQTVAELAADLQGATATGGRVTSAASAFTGTHVAPAEGDRYAPPRPRRTIAIVGIALTLALGATAVLTRNAWWPITNRSPANSAPLSLAILPFRNASGDAALDSLATSVGHILGSEFGQSALVRVVPIDRVHQILRDLRLTMSEPCRRRNWPASPISPACVTCWSAS